MSVLDRWQMEGERHARAGDYRWMAGLVPPGRILEVGCGAGFGTQALLEAGRELLVVEPVEGCRVLTADRLAGQGLPVPEILDTVVGADMGADFRQRIADFAPDCIVCWLMGGEDAAVQRMAPGASAHQAVQAFREAAHRAVVELAVVMSSVSTIHLVDRTAFPWKIKDTARETLVLYHGATTFKETAFSLLKEDTLYRKLDGSTWPELSSRTGAGIVPVLGSLVARRRP